MSRGGASHPLVELTMARLREIFREPEALFWAFIFPILMSVAMAVAFPSSDSAPVPVGVRQGEGAEALRASLAASKSVAPRIVAAGEEEAALRDGDVDLVVVPGTPPTYRYDPGRAESRAARLVLDDALKRAGGRADPWTAVEQHVTVPGSRYVDWLIPGLVGMGIIATSVWGIAFSIVQARMRKLLKRMVASPMRKSHYLLAQVLARLLFLLPEVAIPLLFGRYVIGMPLRGSLVALTVVSLVGALSCGAIGLLAASRTKTFEAVSGLVNLILLPMWIASGVFFSASRFPDALQPFVQALPLTALVDALRAVVLEGATLPAVAGELAILAFWGIVPFVIALKIFRWR
ncbi:MAG TPA: ABC transporter permease [Vicinamibacterales bacterium]|jgi:ABC-2 type transport system permease protein|nr:ABC transporter permease [Vicinamibacterales bacterium]